MIYNNYLKSLSEKFERRLEGISADFNFELGDEFEIAICEILRDFLPLKYGIARGFVVSKDGEKKGDDIIIFDQERFPTLKLNQRDDYSRLENIPIEAVYAYIEAKHTLSEDSLVKAIAQISEIKELCNKRKKVPLEQYDPYIPFKIDKSVKEKFSDQYPQYRNPVFTMILSRKTGDTKKNKEIIKIKDILETQLQIQESKKNTFSPDIVIAGANIYSHAGIWDNKDIQPTVFLLPEENFTYFTLETDSLCYGIALANLFAALDWIRLDKMPWIDLLNEGIHNKSL